MARVALGQGPRAAVANENYLARMRFIFAPQRRSAMAGKEGGGPTKPAPKVNYSTPPSFG
jgi:hypothetical protein